MILFDGGSPKNDWQCTKLPLKTVMIKVWLQQTTKMGLIKFNELYWFLVYWPNKLLKSQTPSSSFSICAWLFVHHVLKLQLTQLVYFIFCPYRYSDLQNHSIYTDLLHLQMTLLAILTFSQKSFILRTQCAQETQMHSSWIISCYLLTIF